MSSGIFGVLSGQCPNREVKNIIKLMKPDVEPDKMIEYVRNRHLDSSTNLTIYPCLFLRSIINFHLV